MTTQQQQGIYSLTNQTNNMKFVGSTTSIHNAEKNLIKKLKNNTHRNKRLQNAWNEYGEANFIFEVLDIIGESEDLMTRKRHWINTYKSNIVGFGYNLELTKRPWEEEREKWRKEKTWGVEGDVKEVLNSITKKLDYSIEFAEDRCTHLLNILDEDAEDWLVEYISSPLFCDKQSKIGSDFLAEDDSSLIKMSHIVDYLVFPKYKNIEEKKLQLEREHTIRVRKSETDMKYLRGGETLFGEKSKIEKLNIVSEPSNPNVRNSEKQKIHKVETKVKISDDDLQKYPEINELNDVLQYLKERLGRNKNSEEREIIHEKLKEEFGSTQVGYMNRLYNGLHTDMIDMKKILTGYINFKNIMNGTTVFNYDEDTGYFKTSEDGQEEYILVSENKIDFSKEKHVLALINFYSQLKQRVWDTPNSDMWSILYDLDNLIETTEFESYMKDILIMRIDGYENSEIIEDIKRLHGIDLTENRLSKIYNETIPKMIVGTYLQSREDWIYTYKVKGTYKTCSKCKEVKLATKKYFSPDKRNRDGFHSFCKNCR